MHQRQGGRRPGKMPRPRGSFLGKWTHGRKLIGSQSFAEADEAGDYEDNLLNVHDGMYHDPSPGGRMSPKQRRVLFLVASLVAVVVLVLLWGTIQNIGLRIQGIPPGLWSHDGKLVIGKRVPFFIKGFSWYGMEEERQVFGGLLDTTVGRVLQFATDHDFNAIRVPLAYDNVMRNSEVFQGIDTLLNVELSEETGLTHLGLLDFVIDESAKANKIILLDLHRLTAKDTTLGGLWYSKTVSEDDVVKFWEMICERVKGKWNVFGADLTNEPYEGLWDNSKSPNNWRRAARRISNVLHRKCPHWLIMVEGVGKTAEKTIMDQPFWGENLHVMRHLPLLSNRPKKVALSPHVYGPSVYNQTYFNKTNFMAGMPRIWDTHFGNVSDFTDSAIIVGEWGGTYVGQDAVWQKGFVEYLRAKGFGFFYWCLNPESADTGGLFERDWKTPVSDKLALLRNFEGTPVKPVKRHFRRRFF